MSELFEISATILLGTAGAIITWQQVRLQKRQFAKELLPNRIEAWKKVQGLRMK